MTTVVFSFCQVIILQQAEILFEVSHLRLSFLQGIFYPVPRICSSCGTCEKPVEFQVVMLVPRKKVVMSQSVEMVTEMVCLEKQSVTYLSSYLSTE